MSTAVMDRQNSQIARPLKVLVPLIQKDWGDAQEASERAAHPYYKAIGDKLIEAKSQLNRGEFTGWIKRNFDFGERQAQRYMSFSASTFDIQKRPDRSPLEEFRRHAESGYADRERVERTSWHEPVKQILGRVDLDTLRDNELKRAEEREAIRKLKLQLIDIGYKALATKLHPDKGGSRDAMARLNSARDQLKATVR